MVDRALTRLDPAPGSLLFIENVGNLVCPALFDLGEHSKVVVISVTEGTDKPLKYPHMFAAAGLVLVNKIDLLPYVDFDLDVLRALCPLGQPGRRDPARLGDHGRRHGRLVPVDRRAASERRDDASVTVDKTILPE